MSRLKELRKYVDQELNHMEDESKRNSAFVHLYGVSLAAAMIAEKRKENTDLACMAAMLHDIAAYKTGSYDDHAHKGARMAREILEDLALTSPEENDIICSAIYHHDDKLVVDSPMDEVLKDADVIHHTMNDPQKAIKEKEQARYEALRAEFGIDFSKALSAPPQEGKEDPSGPSEPSNSSESSNSSEPSNSSAPSDSSHEPPAFRKMRRFKQMIDQKACEEILSTTKRGVLSVLGDHGYPYGIPVNFYYDPEGNRILIHCARQGHKIDAIKACDKVSFAVWKEDYQDENDGWSWHLNSVIAMGRAHLMADDDPEQLEMTKRFGMKYYDNQREVDIEIAKDFPRMNMIEIRIEHMTGKKVHEK